MVAQEECLPDTEGGKSSPQLDAPASTKKKKKKGKKFVELPTVAAIQDQLKFSINFTQKLGRHAMAKRPIAAGELLLREKPVAAVVRTPYQEQVCHRCMQAVRGGQPVTCGSLRFCGKECADLSSSWRTVLGKLEVDIERISRETEADEQLLRLILALDSLAPNLLPSGEDAGNGLSNEGAANGAGKSEIADRGESREGVVLVSCGRADVDALSHSWDRMSEGWRASLAAACKRLHAAATAKGAYAVSPTAKLQELAAIISSNSHGCGAGNEDNNDHALGIFPLLSMFNHSCQPNACFVTQGAAEMQVRALRDIAEGEQLCVAYVNLTEDRSTRQRQLLEGKQFLCACQRCSQPLQKSNDRFLEGLLCTLSKKCDGPMVAMPTPSGNQLLAQEWMCCTCSKTARDTGPGGLAQKLMVVKTEWQQALASLRMQGMREATARFEALLQHSAELLHPLHTIQLDCLMPLFNARRRVNDDQGASQHLGRLIDSLDQVQGIPTPELGNLLDLHSRILEARAAAAGNDVVRKRLRKQARSAGERAVSTRTISLGAGHSMTVAAAARLKSLK